MQLRPQNKKFGWCVLERWQTQVEVHLTIATPVWKSLIQATTVSDIVNENRTTLVVSLMAVSKLNDLDADPMFLSVPPVEFGWIGIAWNKLTSSLTWFMVGCGV